MTTYTKVILQVSNMNDLFTKIFTTKHPDQCFSRSFINTFNYIRLVINCPANQKGSDFFEKIFFISHMIQDNKTIKFYSLTENIGNIIDRLMCRQIIMGYHTTSNYTSKDTY